MVWKDSYFTPADVGMLGNGFGMYKYPQLYDQPL